MTLTLVAGAKEREKKQEKATNLHNVVN